MQEEQCTFKAETEMDRGKALAGCMQYIILSSFSKPKYETLSQPWIRKKITDTIYIP